MSDTLKLSCCENCSFTLNQFQDVFSNSENEIESMVGDTNLFLNEDDSAEAEIMIAESEFRCRRLGWEAMLLMLRYGVEKLKIRQFQAKIKMENSASLKMFDKIGFKERSRSEVFQEVTLVCDVTNSFSDWLSKNTTWQIDNYEH